MNYKLRIARATSKLKLITEMYCQGLGLEVLAAFDDHEGYDGRILGRPGAGFHFEFTYDQKHVASLNPSKENLVVLYVPLEEEFRNLCAQMVQAGFRKVPSENPYWD